MIQNKYELTKTIRFKLIEEEINEKDIKLVLPKIIKSEKRENIKNRILGFIENIEKISDEFKLLFFYDKETKFEDNEYKKIKFTNKLEIKYSWLRDYTKNEFHNFKKSKPPKTYKLNSVDYLHDIFKERINEWLDIIRELKGLNKQPQESQRRRREFAFLFKKLLKKTNVEFMREFVKAIHNSSNVSYENYEKEIKIDERLNNLKSRFEETEKELKEMIKLYLPAQNLGLELLRATFNYYTLNKTPREYDDEIKNKKRELNNRIDEELFKRTVKDRNNKIKTGENKWFKEIGFSKDENWTLEKSYGDIKKWKSDKKKEFMEAIQKINSIEEFTEFSEKYKKIEREHPLFKSKKKDMKDFIEKTIKIEKLSSIKNKIKDKQFLTDEENDFLLEHNLNKNIEKIQEKIIEIKKERGLFLNFKEREKSEIITKNYYELCELFKRIAQKGGKLLADIKSLEYEELDAQLLTHWAFVLEEDNKHSLVLVPRESNNISETKKFIDGQNIEDGDKILCIFQSLTLRALEKLCFKENDNTFKKEIEKEIDKYPKHKRFFYPKHKRFFYQNKLEIKGDKKLICFYQKVLKTDYAKKEISKYQGIENITSKKSKNYSNFKEPMNEFRKDLEQCCYVKRVVGDEKVLKILREKHKASIFLIDSLDLRVERENTDEKIEEYKENFKRGLDILRIEHNKNTQKTHTILWKDFWTSENKNEKYPTRLNPEIRIFWREPRESRVKKYGKGSNLYNPKRKNRFLTEQYTLATTFTLNATNKNLDFAWDKEEDIKDKIKIFNDEFNKNNTNQWVYGIDRGLKELATLCIVDFTNKEKPDFPEITLYNLKEDKYYYQDKDRKSFGKEDKSFGGPIKNISNVIDKIDDEKWFSKSTSKENACIDLTTAKVIKGHIVKNGDVQTLLNLKEIAAKRKLYDLFHKGKIDKNSEIEGTKKLRIKYSECNYIKNEKNEDLVLYWFTDEQKKSFEKKGKPIIEKLKEYLKNLDKNNKTKDEPPIEKINHLRDSITANMVGVINFLNNKFPAKRIALENLDEFYNKKDKMIYNHFSQSNENISRRLEWALYRKFQNDFLVPPNIKQTILLKDEFNETQFGIVEFVKTGGTSSNCPKCGTDNGKKDCSKCGFSPKNNRKELVPLTNWDRVASYNIAKKIKEYKDIKKLNEIKNNGKQY